MKKLDHPTDKSGALDVTPPGTFLQEELDARGWSQADFATIIGRPPRLVNEIIKAKRAITPETATAIGQALATGPEIWMNLEAAYQLSQVQLKGDGIKRRAKIFGKFRVRELQKRGWIPEVEDLTSLERNLKSFFQISDLDAEISIPHAAKRQSYDSISIQQAAWLSRAKQLATRVALTGEFTKQKFTAVCSKLRGCVERTEDLRLVRPLLSDAGIRFIVIEPLPGSKIDGACLWLDKLSPIVVLSLRFDRHDIFWHALWHELDHVEHDEGQDAGILDINMLDPDVDASARVMEERANRNAAARLVPTAEMERFIASGGSAFTETRLVQFAKSINVHPGIVLGQLQHRGVLPWSAYAHLRARVRHVLTQSTPTDGYGVHITSAE